jgi:hypothetical protein
MFQISLRLTKSPVTVCVDDTAGPDCDQSELKWIDRNDRARSMGSEQNCSFGSMSIRTSRTAISRCGCQSRLRKTILDRGEACEQLAQRRRSHPHRASNSVRSDMTYKQRQHRHRGPPTRQSVLYAEALLMVLSSAAAQDIRGLEVCTAEKQMERRTGCLQANVEFLQHALNRLTLEDTGQDGGR